MKTIELINQYYEQKKDAPRYHLGCSEVGHKCDRWLWLSFRHAFKPSFDGRMKRLFRTGQRWENQFVEYLGSVGADIRHTGEDQLNIDLGCHLGGSIDGIIYSGHPDMPNEKIIAEFKTANKRSFKYLSENGVKKSKLQHYVQMQLYMHATGIKFAYYICECKNDSALFDDIISYDPKFAQKYIARAHMIATLNDLPKPISYDGSCFECRYCNAKGFCFSDDRTGEINCRTCAHSTPTKESIWECELHKNAIPKEHQLKQYPCHVWHPELIKLNFLGGDGINGRFLLNGNEILNGKDGISSQRILDAIA